MPSNNQRTAVQVLDLISVILDIKVWVSTRFRVSLPKRIQNVHAICIVGVVVVAHT